VAKPARRLWRRRFDGGFMMTDTTKQPLADAIANAQAFRALFRTDSYERWEIAGSIRRRRPEVSDVDHVVIPRFGDVPAADMFATPTRVNLLWHQLDNLVRGGAVTKHLYGASEGFRWGEKLKGCDFCGRKHELWTADAENWGAIMLIRTGPADFSERVVSVLKQGGVYRQVEGRLIHVASGRAVPTPDEETYLGYAGMGYVEPEARR
jgi:DNA polymerase/3'-5' exonuclease PolX